MQTINQLTTSFSNQNNQAPMRMPQTLQDSSQNTTQISINKTQVAEMFAKWKIYFKSKMKDEEWGLNNILLWTAVLNEFAITEKELIEGTTKACFARELNGWPPTTATDFINVIRGELINNYPDMRQAYMAAANENYSHQVIFETARRVGFWEIKSQSESVSYKLWQQHYPQVCREHADGAQFTLPKSQRIGYEHTPMSADSPMAAKVDDFLNQFKRKHGSLA